MKGFVWVLGGTNEGRKLCEKLSSMGIVTVATVATAYGGELIEGLQGVAARVGRLDNEDMLALLREGALCAVDATHPYAQAVSRNAVNACQQANVPYFRLARPQSEWCGDDDENIVRLPSAEAAAEYLEMHSGHALLATGVNSLPVFARVLGLKDRLSVRVLPDIQSIEKCRQLGFSSDQIIAMKGPFSREINIAMIRQTGASILVTKDGGDVGGAREKWEAAKACGATLVLIERPGMVLDMPNGGMREALCFVRQQIGLPQKAPKFPLFIDLQDDLVVIVGGGKIAARRAKVLLQFGTRIRVIAPDFSDELAALDVERIKRYWQEGDCLGARLVIAATDDARVNAAISEEAKTLGVFVSCADCAEHGNFSFPATLLEGQTSVGLVCGDPAKSKRAIAALQESWPRISGETTLEITEE